MINEWDNYYVDWVNVGKVNNMFTNIFHTGGPHRDETLLDP